ncbi:hypothetical protein FBU30_009290 [Linnemannia zychae]|nr:hypothetical protein FBU30_009290 [Linnemannia zychae]
MSIILPEASYFLFQTQDRSTSHIIPRIKIMGWFSKSSAPVEQPKREDTTAAAATSSASQTPSPEDSTPTPSTPTTATTPTEQAQTQEIVPEPKVPQPLPVMELGEYRQSDDIYERFKVSDAMNQLAACSSLGANIRNYYRYGTFKDCSARYDHLKFCLSLKTKSSQVAQVMIQRRDAQIRAQKKRLPNSEDVWTVRSHPPEELVELSRQEEY